MVPSKLSLLTMLFTADINPVDTRVLGNAILLSDFNESLGKLEYRSSLANLNKRARVGEKYVSRVVKRLTHGGLISLELTGSGPSSSCNIVIEHARLRQYSMGNEGSSPYNSSEPKPKNGVGAVRGGQYVRGYCRRQDCELVDHRCEKDCEDSKTSPRDVMPILTDV